MTSAERFLFSVIIPVYNTEAYLEETLQSIVRQSIGFLENIELILVNNGTMDGSGAICERYQANYPDNVKYIVLEKNVGPSGARNIGLNHAAGEFVNFFDSDDKWGLSAFSEIFKLFKRHPEINIAGGREKRFDAYDAWHIFDYIFDKDRELIDIFEEPDCVCFAAHSLFFRKSILTGHCFDESISDSEDMKFVNQILLREKRYGVAKRAIYYYRERSDGSSLVQSYSKKTYWYFDVLPSVAGLLLEESDQLYGECIPYLRWLIMFNLQGRTRMELPANFTEEECEKYRGILRNLLQYIDDDIIWAQRLLNREEKLNVLLLKYGKQFGQTIRLRENNFYFKDIRILSTGDAGCLALELLKVAGEHVELTIRSSLPDMNGYYRFSIMDEQGESFNYDRFDLNRGFLDRRAAPSTSQREGIRVRIPLRDGLRIRFSIQTQEHCYPVAFRFGRFFPLTKALKNSCFQVGEWQIHWEKNELIISKRHRLKLRLRLLCELLQKRKKTALLYHLYCGLWRLFPKTRQIWIMSDRQKSAQDSGSALFEYVNRQENKNIKAYFALDGSSPDFPAMQKIGRVLDTRSRKYRRLFIRADKIITSFCTDEINVHPLARHEEYIKDLVHSKLVYLQHGVIKDDITDGNSKLQTNISGFVTSSAKERQSMLDYPYGYVGSEIWLTGLARHDGIYDCSPEKQKKHILIAPTWRENIGTKSWENGIISHIEDFEQSEYFKFYERLINDQCLLKVMREHGYSGSFRLHPVLQRFAELFPGNDVISVEQTQREYREELEETALLLTDYSSLAFDFAYICKPCIYAQYDAATFYQGHTYRPGYFKYERDGFGPVCYDYESTVQAMIAAIENDCVMEEKCKKRAEEFFPYRDGKCCERIYQHILEMDKEN